MSEINPGDVSVIAAHDIWQIQQEKKKTLSAVPGELPPRLKSQFSVELCEPAEIIFNNITRSAKLCEPVRTGKLNMEPFRRKFSILLMKNN